MILSAMGRYKESNAALAEAIDIGADDAYVQNALGTINLVKTNLN